MGENPSEVARLCLERSVTIADNPIYDPRDAAYRDEAALRNELARVHDVCNGCRRCVDLCPSFPTLFELLDQLEEPDASLLTPAQQDEVVDACFQCTSCVSVCPYAPGRPSAPEAPVDVPHLMLRAKAVQYDNRHVGTRRRTSPRVLARSDRVGALATRFAGLANRVVGAPPGSKRRRAAERLTGVSATRRLPTYSSRRFSDWFRSRPTVHMRSPRAEVSVFPTCIVEYQATDIGRDLVRVYERNGIECSLSSARCCGATRLHAGDVEGFGKIAERNVATFAREVAGGNDIVVGQPTCAHVIRAHYPEHVSTSARDDARTVAAHTFDAADYLMRRHRSGEAVLDTDFSESVEPSVAYHASGHLRAVEDGVAGRDLMKLTGARVRLVQRSSGAEGIWDLRSGHDDVAEVMIARLADEVERADRDAIAGDCHLSNVSIADRTGREVVHPLQFMARAYGFSPDG